ncbi:MAG: response regulator transcription factor [Chitinophaga sp.]|uniref:response regulator n=1 Tax=Chitinophaga sp. TaxID=1869181 RepID=UPI001B1B8067|nr:response regulator [Chitinophaga sp.]MBO9730241.1 response regulator transcription factor [Chitinophaga sp.]
MPKVLVVDDNRDILEVVAFILSRHEMNVTTLLDPALVRQFIAIHRPDILLMDIAMGNYDGRVLCRQIKRSSWKTLPVILFSARNYPSDSIAESMADGIIEKPFSINDLCGAIQRLLSTA